MSQGLVFALRVPFFRAVEAQRRPTKEILILSFVSRHPSLRSRKRPLFPAAPSRRCATQGRGGFAAGLAVDSGAPAAPLPRVWRGGKPDAREKVPRVEVDDRDGRPSPRRRASWTVLSLQPLSARSSPNHLLPLHLEKGSEAEGAASWLRLKHEDGGVGGSSSVSTAPSQPAPGLSDAAHEPASEGGAKEPPAGTCSTPNPPGG